MSWIFVCGLHFNRKPQHCIFSHWFVLRFWLKTYAINSAALLEIFCWTRNKRNLLFSWTMKSAKQRIAIVVHSDCICFYLNNEAQTSRKNTGLQFCIKLETTCKNSAHLDENKIKKQTKIQHRMVMLRRLIYYVSSYKD